jgi:hypothetical protein
LLAGPDALDHRVLADNGATRASIRAISTGAAAELDRLVVSQELAASRQQPETPERDCSPSIRIRLP